MCAVLSGTKYGLKQTRGKFGLGAKMVGIVLYTNEITLLTLKMICMLNYNSIFPFMLKGLTMIFFFYIMDKSRLPS